MRTRAPCGMRARVHAPLLLLLVACVLYVCQGVVGEGMPGAPVIVEEPTEEIVNRHDPLILNCKAEGEPRPKIRWYRTDNEAPLRSNDGRQQLPDGSLFFYRVRGRDAGTYYCTATNTHGQVTSRRVAVQMAYLREDFRQTPDSVGVSEGRVAVFECGPPKGHPTPVLTWRLDGQDLTLPRHRYRQEGTTLLVSGVVPADEGEYQCVVTNMAGQRVSPPATLTVFESARVGGVVKSMVGVAGHDVTLPCAPTGNPEPQVSWHRADGEMPVGRARVARDWALTLTVLTTADTGVYVCRATNVAGTDHANTSLAVVEPPRVEGGVRPRVAVLTPTHVRQIACPIIATPSPVVFWVRENHRDARQLDHDAHQLDLDPLDYHDLAADGAEQHLPLVQKPVSHLPQILVSDGGVGGGGSLALTTPDGDPLVDQQHNLHVTARHEGLWACMATNEVGGVLVPVHVVGGGVVRNSAGIGMVGVDEVEARAALLTPTLELTHPAPTSPTTTTLKWRYVGRHAPVLGVFVLGCERGTGFVSPRIQQQLHRHDISRQATDPLAHLAHLPMAQAVREGTAWDPSASHLMHEDSVEDGLGNGSTNTTGEDDSQEPICENLRVLGHAPAGVTSLVVSGLHPYTSYWILLVPHYRGVLGAPSNLQAVTTPQDVPGGWAVVTRWWAARVRDGFYALTLHWRPVPPHLAHGVITKYLVMVHELDTGVTHSVSVLGELTSLTLANVTSSWVSVSLTAATVKGTGPASPPARLNLLMAHYKDGDVGVGVVRSAWFLVLAGGAVAVVVVVLACTLATRWCARGLQGLPREVSKSKVCGGGDPWTEVGGLWAMESDELHSDRSEKKLLTAATNADYAEVEAASIPEKVNAGKARLDAWPQGLLCPSPSPSRTSTTPHRPIQQSDSGCSQPPVPRSSSSRHPSGRSYTIPSTAAPSPHLFTSTSCRDGPQWYSEQCACCHEDVKVVPGHGSTNTPSGCSTIRATYDRPSLALPQAPEYQESMAGTDTYEAMTAYDATSPYQEQSCGPPLLESLVHHEHRQLRLNTESTTDLSMNGYNFSDEGEDDTQSCSDTEASFFIPRKHDGKLVSAQETSKEEMSSSEDVKVSALQRSGRSQDLSKSFLGSQETEQLSEVKSMTESFKATQTDPVNSPGSSLLGQRKRHTSLSSASQDSIEEQFERTLSLISQGGAWNIDSDYLSTSLYN